MIGIHDKRIRAWIYQCVAIGAVVSVGWIMFQTASGNLARQNIVTGFDFLGRQAGFVISELAIPYEPTDSVAHALLVGLFNTLKVSLLAAFFGSVIGLAVGIARLSPNPLLGRLALLYVEALRNVPLLLYLFLWYTLIIVTLPPVKEAFEFLPGFFLSNSGLAIPAIRFESGGWLVVAALAAGIVGASLVARRAEARRLHTGDSTRVIPWALAAFAAPLVLLAASGAVTTSVDIPELGRFRLSGGTQVRPEFVALWFGLSLSVSASVAEIVRAGIQAVGKGQWEAAEALGLMRGKLMRLVVLPQALRLIVPPLTNTYLTVFKNSSLAIAIGYPDLVMVSNTVMNKTGQAIETIAIFMGVYLGISITVSIVMNWYNARVALKER